jgi:hypothetical protein
VTIAQPTSSHTANVVARVLIRTERKIEDVLGAQFGCRRGKGTRGVLVMLKTIKR